MSQADVSQSAELIQHIIRRLDAVVVGHERAIRLAMVAVACGGHVLIEDVPGVGKTTLARSLAQILGLTFHRVQGTPDRLPAEIVGSSVWMQNTGEYRFIKGPIFGQCVLFDELNRTQAKTQAALLEAMEEGQVTVDGDPHQLPRPFIVLATQNPIELAGTNPLPEAALDRFFVRVRMGYPDRRAEEGLMRSWRAPTWRMNQEDKPEGIAPLANAARIFALRHEVANIGVGRDVDNYILDLAYATRDAERQRRYGIDLGLSPRAALAIRQAAQAWAMFRGSAEATPDDVKAIFIPCSAHRIVWRLEDSRQGSQSEMTLEALLEEVPVRGSWADGRGTQPGGRR